jgi:hypothetical protein
MPAVQKLLDPAALVRTRRAAVVLPVLLLHVALLWLLTQARPDRAGVISAQVTQPMLLRWIEAVTTLPPLTPAPPFPAKPATETAPTQPPRVVSRAITQAAPSSTSVTPQSEAVAATTPADISPTPAAAAPPTVAPLDLTLRRSASSPPSTRSPASMAAQDSRANSERANFGDKLAQDLGSDRRSTEENLGDGRIRFRSGADCVIVHESRAGQLDPMSQTTRPAPRGAKACK